MPQITVPDDLYARLLAVQPLSEELTEAKMSVDEIGSAAISYGLDALVEDLNRPLAAEVLVKVLVELSRRHPEQTYEHMAYMIKTGGEVMREEARKHVFGFHVPLPQQNSQ